MARILEMPAENFKEKTQTNIIILLHKKSEIQNKITPVVELRLSPIDVIKFNKLRKDFAYEREQKNPEL